MYGKLIHENVSGRDPDSAAFASKLINSVQIESSLPTEAK
jgi:hypothetical protein